MEKFDYCRHNSLPRDKIEENSRKLEELECYIQWRAAYLQSYPNAQPSIALYKQKFEHLQLQQNIPVNKPNNYS